jgi:phosphatidylethanolamine-binding protein (PEBP) family uncharacterized protein
MTLTLRSLAFEPGTPIPARFDHEQGDLSPALAWDGVPEGTAALVLLVDDPDAPVEGSFVHWVLYNLARRARASPRVRNRPKRARGPTASAGPATWDQRRRLVMTPTTTHSGCSPWTSRSR